MAIWHRAMALMLPLSILSCSTVGRTATIAAVPSVEPVPPQTTVTSLNQVPPSGLDTLDEPALRYFQWEHVIL